MKCQNKFPDGYMSPTYSYIKYALIKIFILLAQFWTVTLFYVGPTLALKRKAKFENQKNWIKVGLK